VHAAATHFDLAPNCSLSTHGALLFFGSVCFTTFGVAGVATMLGYWPVLPFAGAEILLLGWALNANMQRRHEHEHIDISETEVVISYSRGTVIALEVAKQLEADGVSVEVVDLRSLRPLDRETVCASVRKTTRAVVLEDDWLTYGVGAEIAATIGEGAFDFLDAPVRRVAAAEIPLPYAKSLELAALPDAADLTSVISQVLDATRFAR